MTVYSGQSNSWVSPKLVHLVYLSIGLTGASSTILAVSLPFQFLHLRLPVDNYGIVVGGYGMGMFLLETFWGRVAFRLATRKSIIGVGLLTLTLVLLLGHLSTFTEFFFDYTLLGAFFISFIPLQRFIGMHASGSQSEGKAVGRITAFWGIGLASGSVIGPIVFSTSSFSVDVVVSFIFLGVSVALLASAPWKDAKLPASRPNMLAEFGTIIPRVAWSSIVVIVAYSVFSFPSNYLPLYGVTFFNLSKGATGVVLGIARTVSLFSSLILGSWGDKHGHPRAVLYSFLILSAGIVGTWLAPTTGFMIASTLVMYLGGGWLTVALLPLAMAQIPINFRGSALGFYGSMEDLGLLIGPIIFGFVWSYLGGFNVFPTALFISIIGISLIMPHLFNNKSKS